MRQGHAVRRHCLILGAGRSGTSLVTGLLADGGYFVGDDLWEATPGNPTGLFESRTINDLNERLLAQVVRARPKLIVRGRDLLATSRARRLPVLNSTPGYTQRWLAPVPPNRPPPTASAADAATIRRLADREDWAYKDPRFAFTLPAWRPHLPDDVLQICMVRDPATVAASVIREVRTAPYLRNLRMTPQWAMELWLAAYTNILDRLSTTGDWLFIHYEQLLDGSGISRLESAIGRSLPRDRVTETLRRSAPLPIEDQRAQTLYERLCVQADFVRA